MTQNRTLVYWKGIQVAIIVRVVIQYNKIFNKISSYYILHCLIYGLVNNPYFIEESYNVEIL